MTICSIQIESSSTSEPFFSLLYSLIVVSAGQVQSWRSNCPTSIVSSNALRLLSPSQGSGGKSASSQPIKFAPLSTLKSPDKPRTYLLLPPSISQLHNFTSTTSQTHPTLPQPSASIPIFDQPKPTQNAPSRKIWWRKSCSSFSPNCCPKETSSTSTSANSPSNYSSSSSRTSRPSCTTTRFPRTRPVRTDG